MCKMFERKKSMGGCDFNFFRYQDKTFLKVFWDVSL